jgi:hypothetical protein
MLTDGAARKIRIELVLAEHIMLSERDPLRVAENAGEPARTLSRSRGRRAPLHRPQESRGFIQEGQ